MHRQRHLRLTILALGIGLIAITLLYALSWNQRIEIERVANQRATAQAEVERQRDTGLHPPNDGSWSLGVVRC
ncbi:MAG: hypothetical protein KatS3mg054_0499 [Chloroflexus sp.]|uniref:hypothetical protein n=1 Tax=Chloroflexus sp. TaxID=1904827 RepID=UPI0021DBF586|nr:hypothetical protein [Chloroflexus sp.]GIV86470.1 MAG: hypothetical protein KatS3mg054_0499 [Chloroflexus sp.]GIV92189.1 MAG: hypothetical protein KatS3mg056_0898 [Chloroflexus sp.]